MTAALAPRAEAVELALIQGDLSRLTPEERTHYYLRVCASLGLNPLTKPFEYLMLNGKTILYARRDCTDQLRSRDKVNVTIKAREVIDGICVVTARATTPDGREDESTGAVNVEGLKGENRANAMMKAETKAKRRVTLSICGLGMLDENEVESIPGVRAVAEPEPRQFPAAAPEPQSDVSDITKDAFAALLRQKGWAWGRALKAIDSVEGTEYTRLKAEFAAVNPEHIRGFAAWLLGEPDAPKSAPASPPPADAYAAAERAAIAAESKPDPAHPDADPFAVAPVTAASAAESEIHFNDLLAQKGQTWTWCMSQVNLKLNTGYIRTTPWDAVPEAHRRIAAELLLARPDVVPAKKGA